jgi:hypothetical protein
MSEDDLLGFKVTANERAILNNETDIKKLQEDNSANKKRMEVLAPILHEITTKLETVRTELNSISDSKAKNKNRALDIYLQPHGKDESEPEQITIHVPQLKKKDHLLRF